MHNGIEPGQAESSAIVPLELWLLCWGLLRLLGLLGLLLDLLFVELLYRKVVLHTLPCGVGNRKDDKCSR